MSARYSVGYEGDVEQFEGLGFVLWAVSRVVRDASGEETSIQEVEHGQARSMHGAKLIIARMCKKHERLEQEGAA